MKLQPTPYQKAKSRARALIASNEQAAAAGTGLTAADMREVNDLAGSTEIKRALAREAASEHGLDDAEKLRLFTALDLH